VPDSRLEKRTGGAFLNRLLATALACTLAGCSVQAAMPSLPGPEHGFIDRCEKQR
jgi:hypothetical protein